MSGLFGSLSIALTSLSVSQQEMAVTGNNVANANSPGYSREIPAATAGDPILIGALSFGTGVLLQRIESLRDPILEIQLHQETQQQSKLSTELGQLQQIQTQFGSSSSGIGADISNFFNSLQQLSADPTNLALRQTVLTTAGNLATDFNTTARNLQTQRSNLDLNVVQSVGEVNSLTAQIASVDRQISSVQNAHGDAGTLVDKQTTLIRQLSGLVDVQVIKTDQGISLATSNGTTLVSGSQSFAISTQVGGDGVQHIFAGSQDITGSLKGGSLAGLIQIRDQEIPGLGSSLDQLAAGLANALNTANKTGYDLNGVAGVNLFVPPPAGGVGAAATLSVSITDPALVAASSDGTRGSNGNLAVLSAVHDQPVANGQTPLDFYSSIVFKVGNDTSNTFADVASSDLILRQLQDQRGSISGVSLDEEAANLIKYQTAYQAAARVVTAINTLLDVAVNLGR
ncbi:MAG TPA: flagellar hook-associated protein FlgK [Candidatus Acidoferrum sp.]|jgi:flagellar hook-associated protein 1 FlgK|nr:flagellar hook-associated protein FlgK [Candidatus Acidoferrum sp.]